MHIGKKKERLFMITKMEKTSGSKILSSMKFEKMGIQKKEKSSVNKMYTSQKG